jgi:Domain of unknown function (DUF4386)
MNGQIENKSESMVEETDLRWKGLYLVSGILMIVVAILSFAAAYGARILYSSSYPGDPAAYLQLVSQNSHLAAVTWSLWILIDFLGIPILVAMYLILKRYNRSLALIGSLLLMFYTIFDVGVTELNSLTLVSLSQGYASAGTAALRASFVSAATYGYYALPLQTFLSFAIGPLGYILWCIPMLRSFFGRWVAIFGISVSIIGLLGALAPVVPFSYILGLCNFLCIRLIAIWSVILGVKLYRYARRIPVIMESTSAMN